MGFYTRCALRCLCDNKEELQTISLNLINAIIKATNNYYTDEILYLNDDYVIDDFENTNGHGRKFTLIRDIEEISKMLPDARIYVWYENDDYFEREFIIKNGIEESSHILNNEYDYKINWPDFGELLDKSLKNAYVKPLNR